MSRRRTIVRAAAVLAAAALLGPAAPFPGAALARTRADAVTISVDSVTPSTPVPSQDSKPITFTLTLTNTTGAPLTGVSVIAERAHPITTQAELDQAFANPTPPATPDVTITPTHPVTMDLAPNTPTQATFQTVSGIPTEGLCLCQDGGVYPLFFSAHTTVNGVDQLLGVAPTYVPTFEKKPQPLHVSWLWPLLERPHRLAGDTGFTDDLLATSVDTGRLSRALQVAEEVAVLPGTPIPLTLLVDPELLDELEVMADTKTPYTVDAADGKQVAGTGQQAARAWLDRLHALLTAHPEIQIQLTPYGDPDVEALSRLHLVWASTMPATVDMTARVTDALAGRQLDTTVAWPRTGAISAATLRTLAAHGVSSVVLNSTAVGPAAGVAAGLARLRSGAGPQFVNAALTSPAVERYVAKAITIGAAGTAALPEIIAELAVRVAQDKEAEHALTITAPRYVDPNVDAAVRTIADTSRSTFAEPISLRDAVSSNSLIPNNTAHLASGAPAVSTPPTLVAAADAASKRAAIASLLDEKNDAAARAYETTLPIAIQRCESSAWAEPGNTQAAASYADQLSTSVDRILDSVHIVRPPSGAYSYTLASSNSPLPVTVDNEGPYAVWVHIVINTVPANLQGFRARDIGVQRVEADQRHTFNIPTTTEHPGRIRIEADLRTPDNYPLGEGVSMTVRSTALGLIGVVITIVAGVVLAIALVWRFARRFRARRTTSDAPPQPDSVPEPVG